MRHDYFLLGMSKTPNLNIRREESFPSLYFDFDTRHARGRERERDTK